MRAGRGLLRLARSITWAARHEALAQARANIDAWTREIEGEGLDAILITISGCGTTVKDYGFMLRTDRGLCRQGRQGLGARARRVANIWRSSTCSAPAPSGLTVAYHSACSLQHGQQVIGEPKELLSHMGFVVKEVPEGHLCCGSAGTYNILQPDIADRLRERKVANIESIEPDVIAAGNIGCITQIAAGTAIPVVHPVELIDWATGGPVPEALKGAPPPPRRRSVGGRTHRENDHGARSGRAQAQGRRRRRRKAAPSRKKKVKNERRAESRRRKR